MKSLIFILLLNVLSIGAFCQNKGNVFGQFVDARNKPISGVTVRVAGISKGTVSDKNGKWKIDELVVDQSYEFIFSSIGFEESRMEGMIVLSE